MSPSKLGISCLAAGGWVEGSPSAKRRAAATWGGGTPRPSKRQKASPQHHRPTAHNRHTPASSSFLLCAVPLCCCWRCPQQKGNWQLLCRTHLLLEQLLLARDVAAVALGQHVLAQRGDRLCTRGTRQRPLALNIQPAHGTWPAWCTRPARPGAAGGWARRVRSTHAPNQSGKAPAATGGRPQGGSGQTQARGGEGANRPQASSRRTVHSKAAGRT